jgi:glucosamine 6-phosphate synthetase-like amidotransferase/phosphosugar isomerase protein
MVLGLKRLEYRGYDSAGLGVDDTQGSQTLLIKTLGKVALLQVILSLVKVFRNPDSGY